MRLDIAASDLHDALKQSAYARGSTPLDHLRHVLLETIDGEHVAVEATDLTTRTRIVVPARVEQDGAVMLEGDKALAVTTGGGGLFITDTGLITRGRSHYQLQTMPAGEFPRPAEDAFTPVDIDPEALAAAIAQVQQSADEKEVRPFCRAVILAHGRVSATTGLVMSSVTVPGDCPVVLIPVGQVRHFDGLLHSNSRVLVGNVRDAAGEGRRAGQFRVEAGNTTVTVTCIDHPPFDPRNLLDPAALSRPRLTVQRKPVMDAVRRFLPFVIVYGRGDSGVVIRASAGRVCITDGAADPRNVEDVTEYVSHGADAEFAVGVAHRYLLSVLGAIDADEVDLYLDATKPHLVLPHGADMGQVAHLIAPQALRT